MMLTTPERALVETIKTYVKVPDLIPSEGHRDDALHIDGFGADGRRVTFDHLSKHYLSQLDQQRQTDVVAHLFENATTWPEGVTEVRCLINDLETPTLMKYTNFQVFVDDVPVSQGVRIETQMRVKS